MCHCPIKAQQDAVVTRAAQKKPEGFSVKMRTPNIAYERRLKALEAIKELKSKEENKEMQYQIRLGEKDISLWCKTKKEVHWLETPLAELGVELPPVKLEAWTKERMDQERITFFANRKHSCTPPQDPRVRPNNWAQEVEDQVSLDGNGEGSAMESGEDNSAPPAS